MIRKVPIRLGDLRISEEFETAVAHRHGHVVAWGHVRPAGYWSRRGEERPRWPAVLCSVDGRECIYSPDLVVLVERERRTGALPMRHRADGPRGWWWREASRHPSLPLRR